MRLNPRVGRICAGLLTAALTVVCPPAATAQEDRQASEPIYGDLNGDSQINATDALLVLQHSVNLTIIDEELQPMADVDADGKDELLQMLC